MRRSRGRARRPIIVQFSVNNLWIAVLASFSGFSVDAYRKQYSAGNLQVQFVRPSADKGCTSCDMRMESAVHAALGPRANLPSGLITHSLSDKAHPSIAAPRSFSSYRRELADLTERNKDEDLKTNTPSFRFLADLTSSASFTHIQLIDDADRKPFKNGPTFGASEHSEVEQTLKTLRGDIEFQQKLLEKLTSIIKTARLRCEEAALLLEERNMLQERILTLEEERASARRTEQETRKELESLRLALAEHELE